MRWGADHLEVGTDFKLHPHLIPRHGGAFKCLKMLHRHKLVHHDGSKYDGYRLTNMGYDFLAIKVGLMVAECEWRMKVGLVTESEWRMRLGMLTECEWRMKVGMLTECAWRMKVGMVAECAWRMKVAEWGRIFREQKDFHIISHMHCLLPC